MREGSRLLTNVGSCSDCGQGQSCSMMHQQAHWVLNCKAPAVTYCVELWGPGPRPTRRSLSLNQL